MKRPEEVDQTPTWVALALNRIKATKAVKARVSSALRLLERNPTADRRGELIPEVSRDPDDKDAVVLRWGTGDSEALVRFSATSVDSCEGGSWRPISGDFVTTLRSLVERAVPRSADL